MIGKVFTYFFALILAFSLSISSLDTFEEPINIPDIETIMINEREYYLISTETQLRMIDYYGLDRNYMQQNDIEISDVEWIPIGTSDNPFTGSYNGNGFKIVGLTDNTPSTTLFGNANSAKLYNITFSNDGIRNTNCEAKDFVCGSEENCQIFDIFFE